MTKANEDFADFADTRTNPDFADFTETETNIDSTDFADPEPDFTDSRMVFHSGVKPCGFGICHV